MNGPDTQENPQADADRATISSASDSGLEGRGDVLRMLQVEVARIRRLDRAARGLWSDRVRDDDYDGVFASLCRRYHAPEWDIDNLRRALEAEIAERAGISIHAVSMELDARLAGRILESVPDAAADEHDTTTIADKDYRLGTPIAGSWKNPFARRQLVR